MIARQDRRTYSPKVSLERTSASGTTTLTTLAILFKCQTHHASLHLDLGEEMKISVSSGQWT
jgi:hypothetical protein